MDRPSIPANRASSESMAERRTRLWTRKEIAVHHFDGAALIDVIGMFPDLRRFHFIEDVIGNIVKVLLGKRIDSKKVEAVRLLHGLAYLARLERKNRLDRFLIRNLPGPFDHAPLAAFFG